MCLSACWKLLHGILGVWRLANGRLERPDSRGLWRKTAGLNTLTTTANSRLERSNNKCLWPECLVEAAARHFRHFKSLKAGKRQAWTPDSRGLWRQTAGLKTLTTNASGQSAWWKLPRGILGILGVWRLANGRLERPKNRGLWRQAGAWTLQQQMPMARVPGGSCCEAF